MALACLAKIFDGIVKDAQYIMFSLNDYVLATKDRAICFSIVASLKHVFIYDNEGGKS